MTEDRLARILERLRAEHQPQLNSEMVANTARIQVRHQFSSDDRARARREMREEIETEVKRLELSEAGES